MSEIIRATSVEAPALLALPVREEIAVRSAVASDLSFIDSLQKAHSDRVGWMQTKALETKIEKGEILVAELPPPQPSPGVPGEGVRVGYCMGQDRYFKRDDVGIIYQMNIVPGNQRSLVGATLLKAMFERSAWGCKLYCCWCAQDIAANKFWEAMGFVPLAFRAGSEKKSRVHIFWQRRIRAGDVTTPYWFPSQTGAGAMKEDRLVLPIPPGTHWSEVRGTILPTETAPTPALPRSTGRGSRTPKVEKRSGAVATAACGGLWYKAKKAPVEKTVKVKEPRKKRKNDPRLVSAARELRDRWLEQVNARQIVGAGKYDVSRAIAASVIDPPQIAPMLAA